MFPLARAGRPSYDDWDYNGMKERLERFISIINKSSLIEHTQFIAGQSVSISEAFSAGQSWCCFELLAADGRLIIARVRLPRHPDSTDGANEHSELYSIECEVATMKFFHENVTGVPFPRLYAYEAPGSQRAAIVGAAYMLIEGFYGNTLQDVQFNICELPVRPSLCSTCISFPNPARVDLNAGAHYHTMDFRPNRTRDFHISTIGSISHFSKDTGAIIGKLSTAVADGLSSDGPFIEACDYFAAIADAKFCHACKNDDGSSLFSRLGPFIFKDTVQNTEPFQNWWGAVPL